MNCFIHKNGLCESPHIGKGSKIWAFAHILPQAIIGEDCNICDHVFIENDVKIGNRVTIKCGVQIWDGITIEDDVFIGPNATFTNDIFPRSKVYPDKFLRTKVMKGASIGANATILPGITIHAKAMIGAGSVVTKDVPENAIVLGNPARVVGYIDNYETNVESKEPGPKLITHKEFSDQRGSLTFGEFEKDIPFPSKRFFMVYNVPELQERGKHAHKECHQYLLCVQGSVEVVTDNGYGKKSFLLNKPNEGLYLPPMTWGEQLNFKNNATLLVFTSHFYDQNDYIHNYEEFKKLSKEKT